MNKLRWLAALSAVCLSCCIGGARSQPLTLSGPISDHAVLPQNAPIELRGTASPGQQVLVSFDDSTAMADADQSGLWMVELGPRPAGGPYELKITSGDDMIEISDLLVGEVWLCSGQSNMEYPIYRALNPDTTIQGPHSDQIRLFQVPHATALSARPDLETPPIWKVASPETVGNFSAVCYLTAQDLHQTNDTPIGLIDSSWGGSQIEAWLSEQSLRALGKFETQLAALTLYRTDPASAVQAYGRVWQDWWQSRMGTQPWLGLQQEGKPVPGPMRDWNVYGDPELEGYTGRVWFTRSVHLSETQAETDGLLSLGVVDERDMTWVNGVVVGATDSWSEIRKYPVSSDLLKPGENVITVMADNGYGAGGMIGPDNQVFMSLQDGPKIDLSEGWQYQIAEGSGSAPSPPWAAISGYSTIHNAMVAPLGSLTLSGAIWYQGESNTGRGGQYQSLLAALVGQWRDQFGAALPVYVIQLPGYGNLTDAPAPSGWSDVREAQRQVAINDPRVGLVVTIDAGDRTDIHPPNKQLVAARTANVVRAMNGTAAGYVDGLAPTSAERLDGVITLTMPTDQLKAISHAHPIGFELCDDENVCAWADARLTGATITLESKAIPMPVSVRYCWGDAPICNLYDADDTPVAPFQEAID